MMMPQVIRGMNGLRIKRQAMASKIARPTWMEASSAKLTWVLSYAGRCDVMVESFAIPFIETKPQGCLSRAPTVIVIMINRGPLQKTEIGSGRAGLCGLAFV